MKKFIRGYGLLETERCWARTRHGSGRCQNYPMANGRCRLHGGRSLRGEQSGRWKHGKYSKYNEIEQEKTRETPERVG